MSATHDALARNNSGVLQLGERATESTASGKLTGPLPWDILDELSDDDDLSTTAGVPVSLNLSWSVHKQLLTACLILGWCTLRCCSSVEERGMLSS